MSKEDKTPSQQEAEAAVRTLIEWAGDDPNREGMLDTPKRVAKAYRDWFSGYAEDPNDYLHRTFQEVHHIALITGKAYVAYLPTNRVVGISKLARVVDVYARRFQVQEKMTAQIANSIEEVLQPKGVGVVIVARHACMTTRGVHKSNVDMVTSTMTGSFRTSDATRSEFLNTIGNLSVDR